MNRNEIEDIAKIAALEIALKFEQKSNENKIEILRSNEAISKKVVALEHSIPTIVATEIKSCQNHQDRKKKWNARTFLIIVALIGSYGFSFYAIFGG